LPSRTLLAVLNVTLHSWPIARPQISGRGSIPSFRGSFPRNPVGGRTFELDRRDSVFGVRAQARTEKPQATNVTWRGIPSPRDCPFSSDAWKKAPSAGNPTRT